MTDRPEDELVKVEIKSHGNEGLAIGVKLHPSDTLGEIKQMLADLFDRPEIITDGSFIKIMMDGNFIPVGDNSKLGTKKELLFNGPPLRQASEVEYVPPMSLDRFDGMDETVELESPRSLRALELESISMEELYYVPLEAFREPGLPKRLSRLHHDFFEAWRLDSLDMCRTTRSRLIEEDAQDDLDDLDTETKDWMATLSKTSTMNALQGIPTITDWARADMVNAHTDEKIYGVGGNWDGIMKPYTYPHVNAFMEGLRHWMNIERVYERPMPGEPHEQVSRFGGKSPHVRKGDHLDLSTPGLKASVAAQEIVDLAGRLKKIKREKQREQVAGVVLTTESVAVVQRRKNELAVHSSLIEQKQYEQFTIEVAEYQRNLADQHIMEVKELRALRDEYSRKSAGRPKTTAQKVATAIADKRKAHWLERREWVHNNSHTVEDARADAFLKANRKDRALKLRIGNIRDITRIKFAREWLERRIRWAKCETLVHKANQAKAASIMQKQAEASARVHDRNVRLAKLIEFKKEYLELRRLVAGMAQERQNRRQDHRRQLVADELYRLASKDQADFLPFHQDSEQTAQVDNTQLTSASTKVGWETRRPPHLSHSMSFGSSMNSMMTSSSVQNELALTKKSSFKKRSARFDFGRFGAEHVQSPNGPLSASSPKSRLLASSVSLPNLMTSP
eukprot:TRINITY_DN51316_c0_g1_i1.p1 TRINITY_DN51316_c0_g1~~TRINITY_DN51316_c0_g1_i1.p1  ORF type:complete len:679 (+),score=93.99 TRINITY_DN51316_c0_g1_i1:200-2236(+)